jgi:hypothetical protein
MVENLMERIDPRILERILECSVCTMEATSKDHLLADLRVLFFGGMPMSVGLF